MNIDQIIEDALRDNDAKRLEELRDMFRPADAAPTPFSAAIELEPAAARDKADVDIDVDAIMAEPQGLRRFGMDLANRIERARRTIEFNHKTISGFSGLRLISEGDSWFQYPFFLKDVIDHLADEPDLAIYSLGAAGDTVANMASASEIPAALNTVAADGVLLSGGGNDLLGDGKLAQVLRPYSEGASAADLLDAALLQVQVESLAAGYRQILGAIFAVRPAVPVFGHAYDVPHPDEEGPWLGTAFAAKNIPLGIGREILGLVMERFSALLDGLQIEYPSFHFVDLRGSIGGSSNSWHDEIHPKNAGFGRAAERISARIRQEVSADSAAPRIVIPHETDTGIDDPLDPEPLSAETYSEINVGPSSTTLRHEALVPFSTYEQRHKMARVILGYEARRVNGKLAVHYLRPDDGGGNYEVAGINERYHKEDADRLVALIQAGRHDEAEAYATEFIANYTDRADRWCSTVAVEFYVRDCVFNRGPGGAAWILQHAVGVETDMLVGPITRAAVAQAERDPAALLKNLRASREVYERRKRDERSDFWKGLVNRWNNALAYAQSLLPLSPKVEATAVVPRMTEAPQPAQPRRNIARSDTQISRASLFESMGDLIGLKSSLKDQLGVFGGPGMATAFSAGPSPEPDLNVIGVGVGEKVSEGHMTGQMSVKVYVKRKFAIEDIGKNQMILPDMDGIPIDVEEIGDVRPLALPNPRQRYTVPVPGCSVGHDAVMAGTFGTLVRDRYGRLHMLSNNHVLAGEDSLEVGAPIYQQGRLDQGSADAPRQVGVLSQVVPLGHASLDTATASPFNGVQFSNDTLHIGPPRGQSDVFQGMELHKFGRTTRYTVGFVSDLAIDVKVPYHVGGVKLFENQIGVSSRTASPFSDHGDSGSLVMSRPGNLAVGLLFAGSPSLTILNPIADVLDGLDVELAL